MKTTLQNNHSSASLVKPKIVMLLLQGMRPKQWTKNVLLFAAVLFSYQHVLPGDLLLSVLAFILFCFVSGAVYLMNDYVDRERDKLHETKRYRPIASGQLHPTMAIGFAGAVLLLSLGTAFWLKPLLGFILLIYFGINILYSFYLKNIVIIDVMIIAAGFVLRALAGGVAIGVSFTPWFLLCTMLLSLFMAIGKRRHELVALEEVGANHRKVLKHYTVALLDQFIGIVATCTIICYSLFTFTSGRTIHLMWSIPFVVYGIFRYLYLIHVENQGGAPDRILLEDKPILFTVMGYVITIVAIVSIFESDGIL